MKRPFHRHAPSITVYGEYVSHLLGAKLPYQGYSGCRLIKTTYGQQRAVFSDLTRYWPHLPGQRQRLADVAAKAGQFWKIDTKTALP